MGPQLKLKAAHIKSVARKVAPTLVTELRNVGVDGTL